MRVLDLFCGAGGAGMGYSRAGFEVVGVDACKQRRYPFAFIEADALSLDPRFLQFFDLIHASPPCQAHSALKHAPGGKRHLDLIPATRAMLKASGVPYVIENVEGAPLLDPVTLCGSMFGLGAVSFGAGYQLQRHRIFEASFPLPRRMTCHHWEPTIGVYGGHARNRSAKRGGRGTADVWEGGHRAAASEALGIDWMTLGEMSQAIPPAYTRWIGEMFQHHRSLAEAA